MDLVVRSLVQNRQDFREFREKADQNYREIFSGNNLTELDGLEDDLTKTLRQYVPESAVDLQWLPTSVLDIPMPQAMVRLVEDGYTSAVERAGHALQRAFIMSLLQSLALAQAKADSFVLPAQPAVPVQAPKMPNLILGIEEPELYQHPGRQRHLSKILMQISTGEIPGVAQRSQIIYSTHSPLFVSLDRFNEVQLTRKRAVEGGGPKVSRLTTRSLDDVADRLWRAEGMPNPKYTGQTLEPRCSSPD